MFDQVESRLTSANDCKVEAVLKNDVLPLSAEKQPHQRRPNLCFRARQLTALLMEDIALWGKYYSEGLPGTHYVSDCIWRLPKRAILVILLGLEHHKARRNSTKGGSGETGIPGVLALAVAGHRYPSGRLRGIAQ